MSITTDTSHDEEIALSLQREEVAVIGAFSHILQGEDNGAYLLPPQETQPQEGTFVVMPDDDLVDDDYDYNTPADGTKRPNFTVVLPDTLNRRYVKLRQLADATKAIAFIAIAFWLYEIVCRSWVFVLTFGGVFAVAGFVGASKYNLKLSFTVCIIIIDIAIY